VQRALDKGADPNRKDAFGNTALDYFNARILGEEDARDVLDAFAEAFEEAVDQALGDGDRPNQATESIGKLLAAHGASGRDPMDLELWTSARATQRVNVQTLAARGADGNYVNPVEGISSLDWALRNQDLDILRMVLDAGANPNLRSGPTAPPPLGSVISDPWDETEGWLAAIKLLLAAGADASDCQESLEQLEDLVLLGNVAKGPAEAVFALLEQGAAVDPNGDAHQRPVGIAHADLIDEWTYLLQAAAADVARALAQGGQEPIPVAVGEQTVVALGEHPLLCVQLEGYGWTRVDALDGPGGVDTAIFQRASERLGCRALGLFFGDTADVNGYELFEQGKLMEALYYGADADQTPRLDAAAITVLEIPAPAAEQAADDDQRDLGIGHFASALGPVAASELDDYEAFIDRRVADLGIYVASYGTVLEQHKIRLETPRRARHVIGTALVVPG
jgi:hypothetical protein